MGPQKVRMALASPFTLTGGAMEFLPDAIALEVREPWGDHLAQACVVTTATR
jgi:hypothetical protein